ncbi:ribitol operon repressor [Klebsiella michiganensis]|nr:ribitol operon repressor [Klebsiella michiganensis]
MLSWQVDWVVATGATNPDKITALCQQAGVPTVNLDLPGSVAPSVISDNYGGAKALTHKILANSARRRGALAPLTFIGGRSSDHNTRERLRGFHDAHREQGLVVPQENILAPGYSKGKVEACLQERFATAKTPLPGLFVNSTISLEGVVRWLSQAGLTGSAQPPMGCFDWDPFVYLLGHDIDMVQQDVPAMLEAVFTIIDAGEAGQQRIEIPPLLMSSR